ncbi:MAG TPA: M1 family aminopeptidase [Vicinamibacterales bacterium]|nr:M1 family aminopeptidase [Vicinamibacterales bacterium]
MTRSGWIALALVAVLAAAGLTYYLVAHRPAAPAESGVPEALARARAARVSNLRYDVTFTIPPARDQPVTGHLRASFALSNVETPLAFDFAQPAGHLLSMHANTNIVEPAIEAQHINIPASVLIAGENLIEFEFVAGDAPLNRSDDYLYALFVPARASEAMPVFDQPDLKARWKLVLNTPPGWTAVSNGRQIGNVGGRDQRGMIFEETQPISTYLFSFAAGRFTIETAERDGRTFRMFHRETDARKLARNRDTIFDLQARALAWLEDYTAIPYAFGKFDFVLIPSFQFGGMEHPGAVFYNASSLLLDESATQTQMLGRASLIAHETAHMWFGDLVTMKWFDDVWMKEVFANVMAAKIVNPSFPNVNHELRFFYQHYPGAYDVDRTEGANPIRQPLSNLNDAASLYGAIIYQKAPIVMRQLELMLGADAFRDGLREYLAAHKFGNASWADLIAGLDARTPVDLAAWSRAWVEERGRPRIAVQIDRAAHTVTLEESDPMGRNLVWPEQLDVAIGYDGRVEHSRVDLSSRAVVTLPPGPAPLWILPTGGGLGYGDFVLDPAELDAVAAALPGMSDPLLRGAALVLLWESMLESRIAPERLSTVLFEALPKETDELNTNQMLDDTSTLFWRFTAADDRLDVAPKLEALLRAGLDRAATTSQKAAWFGALRSVASTPEATEFLEKVWRRDIRIPGLPMAEPDEALLALELAVRDVPQAPEILDTQLARFTNADRKARFAFVRPALSHDPAVRENFFNSLRDVANRRHEAWVLEAVRYLHHPLRAAASKKLVIDALGLTLEIQRTGDIFFPKRWVDATLWGYQSPQTAADVREFIAELPDSYPARLRWVLLSSGDMLFRAAKILHQ